MAEPPSDQPQPRFLEIDLLRTIAILLMIVYHLGYDLSYFYGFPWDVLSGGWLVLERATAILFLLLVGVSFAVSSDRMERQGLDVRKRYRRTARRGIRILAAALLVTAATYWMDPATYVRFGILHLIALATFLLPLVRPLKEGNALLALAVFWIGRFVGAVRTPLLLPFGWTPPGFTTVDYFPVFPWLAAILLGVAIGSLLYGRGLPTRHLPSTPAARRLAWPGCHSLALYLLHQPLLLGALWVFFRLSHS
jgi:uncharacterized membrane protein